jgi:hypothetical protein
MKMKAITSMVMEGEKENGELVLYCSAFSIIVPINSSGNSHNIFHVNILHSSRPAPIPEYPFQSTPSSLNRTWICVICTFLFFTLGYYELNKIERRKHRIECVECRE